MVKDVARIVDHEDPDQSVPPYTVCSWFAPLARTRACLSATLRPSWFVFMSYKVSA